MINVVNNMDNDSLLNKKTKFNNNAIDIGKFIASILVLCIHVSPFSNEKLSFFVQNILARVAVPFFFICTGYFLFKKIDIYNIENDKSIIFKYVKRIFIMYVFWSICYMPLVIFNYLKTDKSLKIFFNTFIKAPILTGTAAPLWYLNSLMVAILIIFLLLKYKVKLKNILKISCILYFLGVLGQVYYGLIESIPIINKIYEYYFKIFSTTRNGVFFGLFYIVIGILFSKNKIHLTVKKSIIGVIISFILMNIEIITTNKLGIDTSHDMSLAMAPTTILIFNILLNIKLKDSPIYIKLREFSTLIYLSHFAINAVFNVLVLHLMHFNEVNTTVRFLIVFPTTLLFSGIYLKLEKIKIFRWLKMVR